MKNYIIILSSGIKQFPANVYCVILGNCLTGVQSGTATQEKDLTHLPVRTNPFNALFQLI